MKEHVRNDNCGCCKKVFKDVFFIENKSADFEVEQTHSQPGTAVSTDKGGTYYEKIPQDHR